MLSGGHSILIPNPRDIPGFIKELGHWQMSTFLGLNTLFVALCKQDDFNELDFSHLRMTISGGMALTHDAAERWHTATGCSIMEGYGLTETSPVVSVNPFGGVQLGTIGLPLVATDVKVIDNEGAMLPPEHAGELCVAGPQVMKGYWQREKETAEIMTAEGYLRTGDIAVLQHDGYLRIVDRAKDMIITSGFNVYPNELEDVICDHPGVLESAAVGVPDEVCGEVVKVFVVLSDDSLQEQDVKAWCAERLTNYKVPRFVAFVEELPKTPVGKILRRKLRDAEPAMIDRQAG